MAATDFALQLNLLPEAVSQHRIRLPRLSYSVQEGAFLYLESLPKGSRAGGSADGILV